MSADWRALSRRSGLKPVGTELRVKLHGERGQVVNVEEVDSESLRLWSITAKPGAVNQLREPKLAAWNRNRLTELVGFYVDRRGRMVGESWIPIAGLTPSEWKFAVYNLARTCDRFEYLLTGRDEE